MRLFRRAKLILREEGLWVLSKKLLRLVFYYSSSVIYESKLDPLDVNCEVSDLSLRVITSLEGFDRLESQHLVAGDFEPSKLLRDKELLSMGAILFCVFVGEELAHITQVFISKRAHDIYPYSFVIRYGHTVALPAFTAPKYRRRGIHLYARSKVCEYLRERGVSRSWNVVPKDNTAMRNSLVKLGAYLWGEGYCLRLLSLFTIEWTRPKSLGASRRIRCSLGLK